MLSCQLFKIILWCLTNRISRADGTSTSRPFELCRKHTKYADRKITYAHALRRTEYKFGIILKIRQLVHVLPQEFEH